MTVRTVKQAGGGTHTTIAAAVAASITGDIVEIQDNATYNESVNLTVAGVVIRAGAGFRPKMDSNNTKTYAFKWTAEPNTRVEGLEILRYAGGNGVLDGNGYGSQAKNCYIHDCAMPAMWYCYGISAQHGYMDSCLVVSCRGGIVSNSGSACSSWNNVFLPTAGYPGIYHPGDSNGVHANNTIVVDGNVAGINTGSGSAINNIVYQLSVGSGTGITAVSHHNCSHHFATAFSSAGVGDITTDPLFVDLPGSDVTLSPTSPCRDTGTTLALVPVDYRLQARPFGTAYDMGAYEYVPAAPVDTGTFWTALAQQELGVRFFALVQGIPYIFLDGAIPTGPLAVAWDPPDSHGFLYSFLEDTLDTSQGVRVSGTDYTGLTGIMAPASFTVRFRDPGTGVIRELFARDRPVASMQTAHLTASLARDTTGAGSIIEVDSLSGWPDSGYTYLGRETMWAAYMDNNHLDATVASGGHRDLFSVGDCDCEYAFDASSPSGPRLISTWPTVWHGRCVQLYAYLVDANGRALDNAGGGAYSAEIWRGVIQGLPRVESSWSEWSVETKSIDSALHTKVGGTAPVGLLHRVPGGAAAQTSGVPESENFGAASEPLTFVISASTTRAIFTASRWDSRADFDAGTNQTNWAYDISIALPGASLSDTGLISTFNAALLAELVGTLTTLQIGLIRSGEKLLLHHRCPGGALDKVYQVTWSFDAAGSLPRLLGFGGTEVVTLNAKAGFYEVDLEAGGETLAGMVAEDALQLEVFIDGPLPSAPGYARIGDQEVVRYESIAPSATLTAGLYSLQYLTRGALNTRPTKIPIPRGQKGDEVLVRFGWGFDDETVFSIILQLAQSTGSAYRGAYDIGLQAANALSPHHFDASGSWAEASNELSAWERRVTLFLSEEADLADLIDGWLGPLGCFVTSRSTSAGFLIVTDRVLPALKSASVLSVGPEHLDARDPAGWSSGLGEIVNEITAAYQWDNAAEKAGESKVTVIDRDSAEDTGTRGGVSWELRGRLWSPAEALANIGQWAASVSQRHGRPYDLLTLRCSRVGWGLRVGDTISLTIPGAPSPDGGDGITARLACVVSVSPIYWEPNGSVGADVTVLLERDLNQTSYCPSARVESYTTGLTSELILKANEFTTYGVSRDSDHFLVGDAVRIYCEGDAATYEDRTISEIDGNRVYLSSSIALSLPLLMVAQPWTSAVATQQLHAFIATAATPHTLGAADPAYRYI